MKTFEPGFDKNGKLAQVSLAEETLFGFPVKVVDEIDTPLDASKIVFGDFSLYKEVPVFLPEQQVMDYILSDPRNTMTREEIQKHFDALKR